MGIASEAVIPPLVAKNRKGRMSGLILQSETATDYRLNTQTRKEITADHFAIRLFWFRTEAHR
jgi:hypothetical protein